MCVLLCVKGDASKSGSEIDSCARSMEDVNGSKKDLSASAGEECMSTVHVYRDLLESMMLQEGCKGLNSTLCDFLKPRLQIL